MTSQINLLLSDMSYWILLNLTKIKPNQRKSKG
jgi:hypothetical protein